MLSTPGGRPARSASTPSASAEYGVCVAGLQTTVQPAASAGAILRPSIADGKFQGVIAATTPTGWRRVMRSEEHTSELKSLMRISYAVFCLKKKKQRTTNKSNYPVPTHS